MKTATILRLILSLFFLPFLTSCLILPPEPLQAWENEQPEQPEFSREELAQMLAPIALYPDVLLSQILMASTYPAEVTEANRWLRRNPGLKGDDLDDALMDMDWDPSVKAMCHFPSILALMSDRIGETTDIGNAFLAQEADVMDMVQELRASAHQHNNLVSNSRQRVIVDNDRIIIEPANPSVIYVSYYDPVYVYGPWWYPAYPPRYWGPPGVVRIERGISYWPAFYFTFGTWSYFDWHRHYIHIDAGKRPRFVRHERWYENHGRWEHSPHHRRGVVYRNKSTAWKYGQDPRRPDDWPRETPGGGPDRDRYRRQEDRHRDERGRYLGTDPAEAERQRRDQERHRWEYDRQQREQERQQREEDRHRMNRDKHLGWDPAEADRGRRERERVERERKDQERVNREAQERDRIERQRQEQDRINREAQERDRIERDRRSREQAERDLQNRQRMDQERAERMRANHERQQQQLREKLERERAEREQQEKNKENTATQQNESKKSRGPRDRGPGSQPGSD